MSFSIEHGFLNPSPSLAAERQGPRLNISSKNETFKPRMRISCDNGFLFVGECFFVRVRMNVCDLWASWGLQMKICGFFSLSCSMERQIDCPRASFAFAFAMNMLGTHKPQQATCTKNTRASQTLFMAFAFVV